MKYLTSIFSLIFAFMAFSAHANESISSIIPNNYFLAHKATDSNPTMHEFIPNGQTLENWDQMITYQIYSNMEFNIDAFYRSLSARWKEACPEAMISDISSTAKQGDFYKSSMWLLSCPNNSSTGKPEFTVFRAIQGKDAFYLVQKAHRKFLPDEEITFWVTSLKNLFICNSQVADSRCSKSQ